MKILLNLLPPIQKKVLRTKYIFRTVLDQQLRILLIMVLVMSSLFAIDRILRAEVDGLALLNANLEKSEAYAGILELHKTFQATNNKTRVFASLLDDRVIWHGALRLLSDHVPSDITVGKFETRDNVITLSGNARRVTSLVTFREKLLTLTIDDAQCFLDVDVPDQYLVKPNDVDFVMTFRVNVEGCMKEKI